MYKVSCESIDKGLNTTTSVIKFFDEFKEARKFYDQRTKICMAQLNNAMIDAFKIDIECILTI